MKMTEQEAQRLISGKISRYFGVAPQEATREQIYRAVVMSVRDIMAEQHQKVAALFETANSKKATSDRFFRDFLQPIIEAVGVEFGLVQLWSTGKLNTPEEITDRTLFLKSGIVKIIDK